MQTEQGWLIGPGDKALACDAQGRVSFDRVELTDADLLEATAVEGDYRATVRSVAHPDRYVTGDATQFAPGGNPCLAFYGAASADVFGPDGKPGFYQRWAFGQWASGIVSAGVDYIEQGANNGRHFKSPQLTWVKKS
jgi:hypothetical protein